MISIRKDFRFESSHKLINTEYSKRKNKEVYGKCYDCISHGHSYKLSVEVAGNKDTNGMIVNFVDLKQMVNNLIISKVDHKFLNEEVDFLKGQITTAENMIIKFWNILDSYLTENRSNIFLKRLELWETNNSSAIVEITKEDCAWLAALIDGEGTITINICNQGGRYRKYELFNGRLSVSNTKKELLDKIIEKFPQFKLRHWGTSPAGFAQIVSKPDMKKILTYIYPYLIIKKRQAELLLEFCNSRKNSGSEIKKLYEEIHELNKKGQGNWGKGTPFKKDKEV